MNKNYTSVRLEITSKCNMNCKYCHNQDYNNQNDDMNTEELISLILELKKYYQINKVLLTGGEPTTKPDLEKIIMIFSKNGIKVDMVTNGLLINEKLLTNLENAGLKRIRISIDSSTNFNSNQSLLSPKNLWNKAKLVKDLSNIELCIHTVCSPTNVEDLFEIYMNVLEVGAKRWRVFDIGYQGGVVDYKDDFNFQQYYDKMIKVSKKIIEHYIKNDLSSVLDIEINNIFKTSFLKLNPIKNFDFSKEYQKRLELSPCDYVKNHQITIRNNGIATLCQYFHNPIYQFKKFNFDVLKALKNETKCEENQIKLKDIKSCSQCKYVLNCSGGCRATAKYLTGNIFDADPSACYLHPLVYKEIIKSLPQNVIDTYEQYLYVNGTEPKYNKDDYEQLIMEKGYNGKQE